MKRILNLILLSLLSHFAISQNLKILHYSETSGFDHQTRQNSFSMFSSFANVNVVHDQSGISFDSLSSLLNYDLIVFSNTSGSAILDSTQRSHFEQYIQNGGNLLGIHAATDTYRHSTANGSPKGVWDFYAQTMGGSVQQAPNHVAGTPFYTMDQVANHQSLWGVPDPWGKSEEYYYWENGYLDTAIQVILKVRQTVGPNNQVNSYDSARAVSWYKLLSSGSRVFYTSLGHANSNYQSDTLFKKHIEQAMNWCAARVTSIEESVNDKLEIRFYPNPTDDLLYVDNPSADSQDLEILDLNGRVVFSKELQANKLDQLSLAHLNQGLYFLRLNQADQSRVKKLVIR